jgi:hypothetical protein
MNYFRVAFKETYSVVVEAKDEKQARKQFNLGNYYTKMELNGIEIVDISELKPNIELTEIKEK